MSISALRRVVMTHYKPSIKGMNAIKELIYGRRYGHELRTGLIHGVTAARFGEEIRELGYYSGMLSDEAIKKSVAIEQSIPKAYKEAFSDLCDFPEYLNIPAVKMLSEFANKTREIYDRAIVNPIAKTKSKLYFGFQKLKGMFGAGKTEAPQMDMAFMKKIFPYGLKLPENLSPEETKAFLTDFLRSSKYSEKEIKDILSGKPLKFYRFVDETELRAMKNGHRIRSTASYNLDWMRTDITADSEYNFNRYRLTFRNNPEWNPFSSERTLVETHDMRNKKFWLSGGYSKDDVLCVERVKNK